MSITKERFEQGLTYAAYRAQMTRNQERFDANEQTVTFDAADLAYFTQLPQTLNVLVLAEDWCGDVINNLPILGRLAAESGKLNVRVFLRDQNLDLMDQYLNGGLHRSIPVFVFFDADFTELGHWIERPARVSEMQAEMRRDLFANDPLFSGVAPDTPFGELPEAVRDRLRAANAQFREANRALFDREVVRELRALLEKGVAQSTGAAHPAIALTPTHQNGASVTKNGQAKVSITYCAECGYEPQTLELTSALMRTFLHELSAIEIIPWQDGAFDVAINGDLVHSMYRDGGFPENEAIIRAVRKRLA